MRTKPKESSPRTRTFERWLKDRPMLDRIEFVDTIGDTMAGPIVIVTRT